MKKTTFTTAITFLLGYTLFFAEASAFSISLASTEDQNPFFEKFVSSLFQNTNKSGAALIGEVASIDMTTSTSAFVLSSKQKMYSIGLSAETKVRKLGIPAEIEDIKVGDKVSVVSSLSKTENPRLRARVVSIISQTSENKSKVSTTTETVATSTEATTTKGFSQMERGVKERGSIEIKEKIVKESSVLRAK